jgi:Leucine-rich repeat (LRR) protein
MATGAITHILLPGNNLQGSIPKELGDITGLNWLDLSDNRLVGQIPPQLADSGLGQLVLRNNALTGPIPAELGEIGPAMLAMDLANNQLSGELPSSLAELSNLNVLLVNDNSLEGPLPASLVRLSALFYFNFQNTRLCVPADPGLKSWLDGLARLKHSGFSC